MTKFATFLSHLNFSSTTTRAMCAATCMFAVLIVAGCSSGDSRLKVYPVRGKIAFEGQPIRGGFVVAHPKNLSQPSDVRATAQIQQDGSFELTTYDAGDGAPAGEYVLTVEWTPVHQVGGDYVRTQNVLPPKYSQPTTSDLVIQVAEGTADLPPLNLRR